MVNSREAGKGNPAGQQADTGDDASDDGGQFQEGLMGLGYLIIKDDKSSFGLLIRTTMDFLFHQEKSNRFCTVIKFISDPKNIKTTERDGNCGSLP